ncbi:hypothetical protein DO97_19360 [Neosynechococcus sphagnicola sy1]|uniref:Uncharacterized protein n=1 Tax=Neosynechococcus sphagnicola sy1 TaxID=1497020 RepID=A0A098THL0_9CYAN|nr:hypothetical protein [Neosynechococcus sphagnicola]KGF71467.1 hypothetical protein DO97_19360 [Neosynechococcus sphagnicola sy1]
MSTHKDQDFNSTQIGGVLSPVAVYSGLGKRGLLAALLQRHYGTQNRFAQGMNLGESQNLA